MFVIKEANSIMNESKEAFRKHLADNYFYKKNSIIDVTVS